MRVWVNTQGRARATLPLGALRRAARLALAAGGWKGRASLSLVLAGDRVVRDLNRRYRGIARTTDVLSFASELALPISRERFLGEVIISLPSARRQARQAGHPLRSELLLLTVHGALHLLGYDHDTLRRQARMRAVQEKVLGALPEARREGKGGRRRAPGGGSE